MRQVLLVITLLFPYYAFAAQEQQGYSNYSEWQELERFFTEPDKKGKSTNPKQNLESKVEKPKPQAPKPQGPSKKKKVKNTDSKKAKEKISTKRKEKPKSPPPMKTKNKQAIKNRKTFDFRINDQDVSNLLAQHKNNPNENRHLNFQPVNYSNLLFNEVLEGNISGMQVLIDHGAEVNSFNTKNGYTPLIYSVIQGKYQAFKYLLSRGAKVDQKTFNGKSAAHFAAKLGRSGMLESLIAAKANMNEPDKLGNTPLDYMAQNNMIEALKKLTTKDKRLLLLSKNNNTQAAISLLNSSNPNPNVVDKNGNTAFIYAVNNNNQQLTNYLLAKGAVDFNIKEHKALSISHKNLNSDLDKLLMTAAIKNELTNTKLHEEAPKEQKIIYKTKEKGACIKPDAERPYNKAFLENTSPKRSISILPEGIY